MQDYYDPSPRVVLDEPLVLGGQVGAGIAAIARAMSARTGVPFAEVDRMAENAAGRSLGQIVADEGPAALVDHCGTALRRALSRRPPAFVVLGSAIPSPRDLRMLQDESRFVYVRRPPEVLVRRIQDHLAAQPGSLFQFSLGIPRDAGEIEPLLAAREAALGGADVVVEAGDRHANTVASELLGALDRILGVRSL